MADAANLGAQPAGRQTVPAQTDLMRRGLPVPKEQVARWFLLGSLALIVVGAFTNWTLTDGTWEVSEGIQVRDAVRTGDDDAYVTSHPYDVVTTLVLVASLILLGAGFLQPMMGDRLANNLGRLGLLVTAGFFVATYVGRFPDFLYAWIALGIAVPFILRTFLDQGARAYWTRGIGFVLFGLYWATQAMRLFTAENGDYVNMIFSFSAVPFFNYFAYHEALSFQRRETPRSLLWLSGTAAITTGVYFVTHKVQTVSEWLILVVADQTHWMLRAFGQDVRRLGGTPEGSRIFYPQFPDATDPTLLPFGHFAVQIILACTAIQSIMIFVGGILALQPPRPGDGSSGRRSEFLKNFTTYNRRRFLAFLWIVPLIYVLNLFRNTLIIWMSGQDQAVFFTQDGTLTRWICGTGACSGGPTFLDNYAAFWFSHNVVGKGGSLLALIIIAFLVFRGLPELYDSIIGLADLRRRRGPLERWLGERLGRGGQGGAATPASATKAETPRVVPAPPDG